MQYYAALVDATTKATTKVPAPTGWIERVYTGLGLFDRASLFKMLIWAFVAGFFEQLVPDMLDSIAARTKQGTQKEAIATGR